jgi:hypothetical protein
MVEQALSLEGTGEGVMKIGDRMRVVYSIPYAGIADFKHWAGQLVDIIDIFKPVPGSGIVDDMYVIQLVSAPDEHPFAVKASMLIPA